MALTRRVAVAASVGAGLFLALSLAGCVGSVPPTQPPSGVSSSDATVPFGPPSPVATAVTPIPSGGRIVLTNADTYNYNETQTVVVVPLGAIVEAHFEPPPGGLWDTIDPPDSWDYSVLEKISSPDKPAGHTEGMFRAVGVGATAIFAQFPCPPRTACSAAALVIQMRVVGSPSAPPSPAPTAVTPSPSGGRIVLTNADTYNETQKVVVVPLGAIVEVDFERPSGGGWATIDPPDSFDYAVLQKISSSGKPAARTEAVFRAVGVGATKVFAALPCHGTGCSAAGLVIQIEVIASTSS